MLQELILQVAKEADKRMPDLVRYVLTTHKSQCIHMLVLQYIEETLAKADDWLKHEACYGIGGMLEFNEQCKFNRWCAEVSQSQSYARVEEHPCRVCKDCVEKTYDSANLWVDMSSLLTMTWKQAKEVS